MPCAASVAHERRAAARRCVGARPSDSSSIISSRGCSMNAMPSVSICCWPPERLPAGSSSRSRRTGNSSSTCSVALATRALSLRCSQPASRRFSATVSDGNTPWPPGTMHDAAARDLVRRRVRHVAAVEDDRAVGRLDEAGDRLQQRRLARAVRAEQRDDLALVDLEVRRRTAPARCRSARRRCGRAAASPRPAGACSSTSACAAVEVHTRLMSDFTYSDADDEDPRADEEDRHHDQQARRGCRSGRRCRRRRRARAGPGRMNSDAIAKPERSDLGRDRERERREDARHEQRRRARRSTMFIAIASQRYGREREHDPRAGDARRRRPRAAAARARGRVSMSRDASGMPSRIADDLRGLGDRGDEASLRRRRGGRPARSRAT